MRSRRCEYSGVKKRHLIMWCSHAAHASCIEVVTAAAHCATSGFHVIRVAPPVIAHLHENGELFWGWIAPSKQAEGGAAAAIRGLTQGRQGNSSLQRAGDRGAARGGAENGGLGAATTDGALGQGAADPQPLRYRGRALLQSSATAALPQAPPCRCSGQQQAAWPRSQLGTLSCQLQISTGVTPRQRFADAARV